MTTTWPFYAASIALAAAAIALIVWGLFWDRARGRRRCPKCWCDMTATEGLICPECGKSARAERRLRRTRRRWWPVRLALLLFLAAPVVWWWPQTRANGVIKALPNWALVSTVPVMVHPTGVDSAISFWGHFVGPPQWWWTWQHELYQELCDRLSGSFTERDSNLLCFWARIDGREAIRQRALQSTPSPRMMAFAVGANPQRIVRTRAEWPEGIPLFVRIQNPFPSGNTLRVLSATPRIASPKPAKDFRHQIGMLVNYADLWRDMASEVGTIPTGATSVVFDLKLDVYPAARGIAGVPPQPNVCWRHVQTIPIEIVPTVDDILTPVTDSRITDLLRSTTRLRFGRGYERPNPMVAAVVIPMNQWVRPKAWLPRRVESHQLPDLLTHYLLKSLTVALRVEYLISGEVVATGRCWSTHRQSISGWLDSPMRMRGDSERVFALDPADPAFTVRISGDGEMALRHFEGTHYWAGSFEVPMSEILAEEQ